MLDITNYTEEIFEKIKHVDLEGNEFWYAREIMKILEYNEYRYFLPVINRAKNSCLKSIQLVTDHFVQVHGMISIGKGGRREVEDYRLSRYACYLIAQNGDPKKKVIALAQTYFAVQTRKQELIDEEYKTLSEDERRLRVRKQVSKGNYGLNRTALKSGVKDLGEFHNAGYKGLYNGETANDIAKRKNLKYNQDILDHMGSTELADNLFRIVQTEDMLNEKKIDNEYEANLIHFEVGKKVRKAIKDIGGTMPEDLPKPISSIKQIKKKDKKDK